MPPPPPRPPPPPPRLSGEGSGLLPPRPTYLHTATHTIRRGDILHTSGGFFAHSHTHNMEGTHQGDVRYVRTCTSMRHMHCEPDCQHCHAPPCPPMHGHAPPCAACTAHLIASTAITAGLTHVSPCTAQPRRQHRHAPPCVAMHLHASPCTAHLIASTAMTPRSPTHVPPCTAHLIASTAITPKPTSPMANLAQLNEVHSPFPVHLQPRKEAGGEITGPAWRRWGIHSLLPVHLQPR